MSNPYNERTVLDKQGVNTVLQVKWPAIPLYYYAPRKISGEHIVAALSVRPSVRPYDPFVSGP